MEKEKTIHICHKQLVTILGTRYRAERWSDKTFEFVLVDAGGKDFGLQRFTEERVYNGIRENKIKIIY